MLDLRATGPGKGPSALEVVAAVIERPDGAFLMAKRPEGKPYPGFWEFPGGKIEPGEDPRAALARELKEELGIELVDATPWITRVYAYTHATVRLHFFRVTAWRGEPQPLEDQAIEWQRAEQHVGPSRLGAPAVSPMLPANAPVLAALALPAVMVISDTGRFGFDGWVERLAARAPDEKMLVQVREKGMPRMRLQHLVSRVLAHAGSLGARVVVNSDCGPLPQCDGLHLTARALMQASARPAASLVGASCHDERELAQAEALALDYAVLGPVKATPSHPQAEPIGWERFAELARDRAMPVYAIGGLTRADLDEARRRGAHGVALVSAAFG